MMKKEHIKILEKHFNMSLMKGIASEMNKKAFKKKYRNYRPFIVSDVTVDEFYEYLKAV